MYSTGKTSTCCKLAEKPPPPLSACWWDTQLVSCHMLNHISCIIEHLIWDLAEEPPPPPSFNIGQIAWEKLLETYFHAPVSTFDAPLKSILRLIYLKVGQKNHGQRGKNFETGSFYFMQFPATLVQLAEKLPPSIQISSLGYQLGQLFKVLTYREVQDTGSWCRWKACRQPYH